MTSEQILEKIAQTIRGVLNSGPIPITRQTRALDVRGWDSLSHTVILLGLEEAFQCELPMDRLFQVKNVGDLADLVTEIIG